MALNSYRSAKVLHPPTVAAALPSAFAIVRSIVPLGLVSSRVKPLQVARSVSDGKYVALATLTPECAAARSARAATRVGCRPVASVTITASE